MCWTPSSSKMTQMQPLANVVLPFSEQGVRFLMQLRNSPSILKSKCAMCQIPKQCSVEKKDLECHLDL